MFCQHLRLNFPAYFRLQLLCSVPQVWHKFAKLCCRKNHQKLFAQMLLCFGAKKVGEINP
jgi:hypothetical protein